MVEDILQQAPHSKKKHGFCSFISEATGGGEENN